MKLLLASIACCQKLYLKRKKKLKHLWCGCTLNKNPFLCIYVHVGSLLRVQLQSTKALEWVDDIWVRERVLPWADIRRHPTATGHTPLVTKTCQVHLSHTVVQISKGLFECDATTFQHTDGNQQRNFWHFRRHDQVPPRIHRWSHHFSPSSQDPQQPVWTTSIPNAAGVRGHYTAAV